METVELEVEAEDGTHIRRVSTVAVDGTKTTEFHFWSGGVMGQQLCEVFYVGIPHLVSEERSNVSQSTVPTGRLRPKREDHRATTADLEDCSEEVLQTQ